MEIVLAWTAYLGLGVLFFSLGWAWLAPRLPRRARLAVLWLLAALAVLALAVTAYLPHNYRLGDTVEDSRAMQALGTQLLVGIAGGAAALAAIGRRLTQNARLLGVGVYLAGVGLCLYVILEGQATIQAPTLVLVGSAVALASAARLSGLPRWPARAFGLSCGLGVALAVEALRGPGNRGGGPATASSNLLSFVEIGAFVLFLAGMRFLWRRGDVVAGSLNRAAIGIAGTALVLLWRGPGEWAPSPGANSTTLYGLPLTLLALAVSLIIAELPARIVDRPRFARAAARLRRAGVGGWAPAASLALLVVLAAVWHPVPEPCIAAPYSDSPAWASSPQPSAPRGAPGLPEFDRLCTHRAQNLGQIVYAVSPGCKWAQVDPSYPLVQASGTLRQIDLSSEDSPWLHTSHDLGLEVAVDPASAWLAFGGLSPGTLHTEVESGPFPDAYRPVAGERVTVAGRWVFDCGHDPKTELHPAAVVASEHDEWRSDAAGGPQQVRVVRIWMNSQPGVVRVPLVPFNMQSAFPSRPSSREGVPAIKVSAGPSSAVQWSVDPRTASVDEPQAAIHITPPARDGSTYFELLLGYKGAAAEVDPPAVYQVAFDRLLVRDDLRSAARNTTGIPNLYFPQLGLAGSGNWNMQVMVGSAWRTLLANVPVLSGRDYTLSGVPPVRVEASGDGHLPFSVTGYAENDPSAGVGLASGSVTGASLLNWDAGRLAELCCGNEQTFTPPHGAWTLYYHVNRANP